MIVQTGCEEHGKDASKVLIHIWPRELCCIHLTGLSSSTDIRRHYSKSLRLRLHQGRQAI